MAETTVITTDKPMDYSGSIEDERQWQAEEKAKDQVYAAGNSELSVYGEVLSKIDAMGGRGLAYHQQGLDNISNSVKGAAAIFGMVPYEQVLNDQGRQLHITEFTKDPRFAASYVPMLSEVFDGVAEAAPYTEATLAAMGAGGAAGAAIGGGLGAGAGAVAGTAAGGVGAAPGAGAGFFAGANGGARAGSLLATWAATATMDAGEMYLKLKKENPKMDDNLAKDIALGTGALTGLTGSLNANVWTAAMRNSFKKQAVSHLAKALVNPRMGRYLTAMGIGGASAGTRQTVIELAQHLAAAIDGNVPHPQQSMSNIAKAVNGGLLTMGITQPIMGGVGTAAGAASKASGRSLDKLMAAISKYAMGKEEPMPVKQPGTAVATVPGTEVVPVVKPQAQETVEENILEAGIEKALYANSPAAIERMIKGRVTLEGEVAQAQAAVKAATQTIEAIAKSKGWVPLKSKVASDINAPLPSRESAEAWLNALVKEYGEEKAKELVGKIIKEAKGTGTIGVSELIDIEERVQIPTGKLGADLFSATKRLKVAKGEVQLFDAEEKLRDVNVIGGARAKALVEKKNALVEIAEAGVLGDKKEQLVADTDRTPSLNDNELEKWLAGKLQSLNPYRMKFKGLFQRSKDAEALSENYTLTHARQHMDKIRDGLNVMFKNTAIEKFDGMAWGKVAKIIKESSQRKVEFWHDKAIAGKTIPEKWSGTEAELTDLWVALNDPDLRNGFMYGNKYSFNADNYRSLYSRVKARVEGNPNLVKLAATYKAFYQNRKGIVKAFAKQQTGHEVELDDDHSGRATRTGYADLDLNYEAENLGEWMGQLFNKTFQTDVRNPGMLKARKSESKLPIEKADPFQKVLTSNSQLAKAIAFANDGPVHAQLLKDSGLSLRVKQVFGNTNILDLLQRHFKDITLGVPKAEDEWTKASLKLINFWYPLKLFGDVFQYPKQMAGSLAVIQHVGVRDYIKGQIEYHNNSAEWDAKMSQSHEVASRYTSDYGQVAKGLPAPRTELAKEPGLATKIFSAPLVKGDAATVGSVYVPVFLNMKKRGFSDQYAARKAEEVVELTQSTSKIENLPDIARAPGAKAAIGAFMSQPQIMLGQLASDWQAVLQHGFNGDKDSMKVWKKAVTNTIAARVAWLAYASIGASVRIALSKGDDDKVSDEMANLGVGLVTDIGLPIYSDMAHSALLTSMNTIAGKKGRVQDIRSVPFEVLNQVNTGWADANELVADPGNNMKMWEVIKDLYPAKPITALDALMKEPTKKRRTP